MIYRALSLTQPWATLVVTGQKQIETRSWKTPYRGWLGIHAAKGMPAWARELCYREPFLSALIAAGIGDVSELPRGALIGGAVLLDCCSTNGFELDEISETERAFGDYGPDRYGWMLERATSIEPREMRGALGLWAIPAEVSAT